MSAVETTRSRREGTAILAPGERDAPMRPRGNELTSDDASHITLVKPSSRKPHDETAQPPVQPGEVLAAKYRVQHVLGSGQMGVVVAARHVQLGFSVAIKFMHPETASSPHAVERFFREARAVARLRGEHTARLTDFGTLDGGAPYIVMELLEGSDLGALLDARGALPVEEAVGYLLDACAAMEEAHQAGVVHRDLKPRNLFLTHRADGTPLVKVLDFGISKLTGTPEDQWSSPTRSGAVLGSPGFMSPEQIRDSRQVDARSDVYGLGAVLYYLIANDYPFSADSVGGLFTKILYEAPRPLRERRPDVSAALEAVVARCLQKAPGARYSSAKSLMRALRAAMAERASSVLRDAVETPVPSAHLAATALVERSSPWRDVQPLAIAPHALTRAYVAPGAATVAKETRARSRAWVAGTILLGIVASVATGAWLASCVHAATHSVSPTTHHTTTR